MRGLDVVHQMHAGGFGCPDGIPCCTGGSFTDAERCEQWHPVLDEQPSTEVEHGPMAIAETLCHDCAYRPGSPERAQQGGDQLDASIRQPFTCHQGMARAVRYEHPNGHTRPGEPGDYRPVERGGQAWRTGGTLAQHCAGWAAVCGARR
ncbi:hypothetical protein GCM10027047_01520 [Rhodococcus aerolatus]